MNSGFARVRVEILRNASNAIQTRENCSKKPISYSFTEGKKRGALRCLVACSYAYPALISVGSLHAVPINDPPTGNPNSSPIGTVMCGYPATAAKLELL